MPNIAPDSVARLFLNMPPGFEISGRLFWQARELLGTNLLSLLFAVLGLIVAALVWKRTRSSDRALPYAVGGLLVASSLQIARVLLEQGT